MELLPFAFIPLDELLHLNRDLCHVRRYVCGTAGQDILLPVCPGMFILNPLENQPMDTLDLPLGQRLLSAHDLLDIKNCFLMVNSLQMFMNGFPPTVIPSRTTFVSDKVNVLPSIALE